MLAVVVGKGDIVEVAGDVGVGVGLNEGFSVGSTEKLITREFCTE